MPLARDRMPTCCPSASIRTSVGQLSTPNRFQITWLASLTTGCLIRYSRDLLADVLGVLLGVELGGVDADDDQLVLVLLLELGEVGQDVVAVDAAERPEVEQDDLALELVQAGSARRC